jgi:hypothetical protein
MVVLVVPDFVVVREEGMLLRARCVDVLVGAMEACCDY